MISANFVPASDDGTDNLNCLSTPLTVIDVLVWVNDSEGREQTSAEDWLSSVNTCGVGACVVIQPVSGNVAIRQHSSSARAVMAMNQPIVLILTN